MKNGAHAIGLFQGMFEKNILTFNPGWDSNANKLATFTDVRDLQRQLKADGVQLVTEADEATTGPPVLSRLTGTETHFLLTSTSESDPGRPGNSISRAAA